MSNNNTPPTSVPGYFQVYINQVKETNLAAAFTQQSTVIKHFLAGIDEQQANFAYAPGKWTLKEVLQHLADSERIFAYRALCFARGEQAVLPGFDENEYASVSNANERTWEDLVAEFVALRRSTLFLFNSFTPAMLAGKGTANNNVLSVESIGFILLGHFTHHIQIMEERYLSKDR